MKLKSLCGGELPSALLFDLDGTLLDSAPDLATAVDRMLLDLQFAPAGIERVRKWVGDGARQLVSEALQFAQAEISDRAVDAALEIYQMHYAVCCTERSELFAAVVPTLQWFHTRGIPMACVTNKGARFTESLIAHFQLHEFLTVIVSGDTLPQRKPNPQPLLFACEQLQAEPRRALMIGDSRNDVLAARAAKMPVVCVDYGYNHGRSIALEQPDLIIASLLDLTV
ncbi:MAG: phosphoglycolate phosphatase [Verrucomicrobiaceae bacterium]|nr:phosphoglycolate phosphatase [Verrucomicrobiaceae bacterium]